MRTSGYCASSFAMDKEGMRKAAVLPEPVCACTAMLLPSNNSGMHCVCTGLSV